MTEAEKDAETNLGRFGDELCDATEWLAKAYAAICDMTGNDYYKSPQSRYAIALTQIEKWKLVRADQ